MSNSNERTSVEVSKDYALYQSQRGRYFIGETPIIYGPTGHMLALLRNPVNSNRNIYVNAMTITNVSGCNLSAEFYLRSSFNSGNISEYVTCVNTTIVPPPNPKGQIKFLTSATDAPSDGIPIFSRIVSPNSTLIVDGGQIILAPGQSIIIYVGGFLSNVFDQGRIAFGWWEQRASICNS